MPFAIYFKHKFTICRWALDSNRVHEKRMREGAKRPKQRATTKRRNKRMKKAKTGMAMCIFSWRFDAFITTTWNVRH